MQNVIVRTRGDPLVLSLSTARIRVGTSERASERLGEGRRKRRSRGRAAALGERRRKVARGENRSVTLCLSFFFFSFPFLTCPSLNPCRHPHHLPSAAKSVFVDSYNSWCLLLREPLRVVTALEVSSASSPALDSRASAKKRKMESKLFQEVSSCRSVPARQTMETETASRMG